MAHATKEKALAYQAAFREKMREHLKAYRNDWYQKNIERERKRSRKNAAAYAAAHPEKITARNKAFYEANRVAERKRSLDWALANPEKVKARKRRGAERQYLAQIKVTFGLTPAQYYDLLGKQNGVCRICGKVNDGKRLHIDHRHVDGYELLPPEKRAALVRGLLCYSCNVGIGLLRDSPTLLIEAAEYIKASHG